MVKFTRRALAGFLGVFALALTIAAPSGAAALDLFSQPKYAAVVVDAASGEVLYAKRADAHRYPASISKIMTLYLTFEALSTGRLSLNDEVPVSAHAASMSPSKTDLRPGDSLTVDQAIRIVAVHSANDIAVALAEKIGGSEPRFAALMTLRAQELGMKESHFVNASGLPDNRQISSPRDIAILCRAVMRDYPQYYGYFGIHTYALRGKVYTNHNHLLREPGYDGFKTGYTNAAGFNLAASSVKNGRRLITVVMGGSSAAARDDNVETLMNAGFDVLRRRAIGQRTTIAMNIAEPDDASGPIERPAMEQGSGDQAGLSVELADASVGAPQPYVAAARLPAPQPRIKPAVLKVRDVVVPAKEDCTTVSIRGRHHHVAHKRVCKKLDEPMTTADCAHLRGAHKRSCVAKADKVELAAADPCDGKKGHAKRRCEGLRPELAAAPAADCGHKHGRALHVCERKNRELAKAGKSELSGKPDKTELAKLDDKASAGGHYQIQVGSFPNRKGAAARLSKVSSRYADVVGERSQQVTSGGAGYRARFGGFSASAAKAACARLSARGEPCLVLSSS